MTRRDEAISELMRRIREQRARLDPEILRKAEQAILSRTRGNPAANKGAVPYDRKAALKAVTLFLQSRHGRAELEKRLQDLIRESRH